MLRLLPNLLTALRLVLLPAFAAAVLAGRGTLAAVLLGASGLSDVLDGFAARRLRAVSTLGRILDPAADKLTQVTALVLLTTTHRDAFTALPAFVLGLVLARDLLLVYGALRVKRATGRILVRSRWQGKATTALVFAIVFFAVLGLPRTAIDVLAYTTIPFVVASSILYARDGHRQIRNAGAPTRSAAAEGGS